MRFVRTPCVRANLRTWVLPSPNRRMMSKHEYQCSERETLGGVGFDARYRVPHTEVVEPSVGIIELLAYLCHRIKVSADTFPVRESITHGLLIVCRRNEPPFCRAAICSFLSLLSDKLSALCPVFLRSFSSLSFSPAWRISKRSACSRWFP